MARLYEVSIRVLVTALCRDAEIRKNPTAHDIGSHEEVVGDYADAVAEFTQSDDRFNRTLDQRRFLRGLRASNYMLAGKDDQAELRAEAKSLNLINTKILLLRDGRITFEGTDEQLWDSDNPYIRNFIRKDDQGMSKKI